MHEDEYLIHYGVLGMKWGVRKKEPAKGSKKKSRKSNKKNKFRKAIKIGAAVAATALVAYGTYRLAKSGRLDAGINKGKEILSKITGSNLDTGGFKKLKSKETISQVIKSVNSAKGTPEGTKNCTLCSVASVLRLKGFDVSAMGSVDYKNLGGIVESAFKNTSNVVKEMGASRVGSASNMASVLTKRYGDGAIGSISLPLSNGAGHAFNWMIDKGKVIFFDGQLEIADASKLFDHINPNGLVQFARLDDLEPNMEFLKNILK